MIDLSNELQFHARHRELSTRSRTIDQRIEWDALQRVDRLEAALAAARDRLHLANLRTPTSSWADSPTR